MTSSEPLHDEKALKRYYAERASSYEQIYQRPERQSDLELLRRYLQHIFRGQRVIDVACGTGFFTAQYAPTANTVMGIDSSNEALAIARAKNIDKAAFVQGDAYQLGGVGQRFDAAFFSWDFSFHTCRFLAARN